MFSISAVQILLKSFQIENQLELSFLLTSLLSPPPPPRRQYSSDHLISTFDMMLVKMNLSPSLSLSLPASPAHGK